MSQDEYEYECDDNDDNNSFGDDDDSFDLI